MKFKIGDRVRRVGSDFGNMVVGDIGTIHKYVLANTIEFKGDSTGYDPEFFELVCPFLPGMYVTNGDNIKRVKSVPGMPEYDSQNFVNPERGFCIFTDEGTGWGRQEDWKECSNLIVEKYKVINPFKLVDIYKENPCRSEFIKAMDQIPADKMIILISDIEEYQVLIDNIVWLVHHGFIEKVINDIELYQGMILFNCGNRYEVVNSGDGINWTGFSLLGGDNEKYLWKMGRVFPIGTVVSELGGKFTIVEN